MKTAIIGAGIAGAYLHRMLRVDHKVDLFSVETKTRCKQKPCGWVVSRKGFLELGPAVGMRFNDYILTEFDHMIIWGKKLPADVAVIDKPALVRDLLGSKNVSYERPVVGNYDRVIDATGIGYYMPPRDPRYLVKVQQARCKMACQYPEGVIGNGHQLSYKIPLGDGTVHVGYGALGNPQNTPAILKKLIGDHEIICKCVGTLWVGGPRSQIAPNGVIGVGESIGLVDPMSGMGIIPAMDSARALGQYWRDVNMYEDYIRHRYHYMVRRFRAINTRSMLRKVSEVVLSYKEGAELTGFKAGSTGVFRLIGQAYRLGS